ncbi:MAG: hypothetical protein OSB00_17410, partial [Sphingomonas bacterium]|nr:hypothetical protein [Sphingomonas bacterium]
RYGSVTHNPTPPADPARFTPVTPLVEDLQAKGVPVIIVSGYGSRLELPQGTLGVDFMPKPVARASLIERAARRLGSATSAPVVGTEAAE